MAHAARRPWSRIVLGGAILATMIVGFGCDKVDVPPGPDLINIRNDIPIEVLGIEPDRVLAGETVTITGSGFPSSAELNRVFIGGAGAPVVSANESTLVITVPVYAANGAITVSDASGWRSGTSEDVLSVQVPERMFNGETLRDGYTGEPGQPMITWDLAQSITVPESQSTVVISGNVTGASGEGYWAIIDEEGFVRSQGVLPSDTGTYSQELPVFCGQQGLLVYYSNEAGRAFYLADLDRTDCDEVGIRVKLSWDTDITDVDLHLLQPGGSYGEETDCYFANRNPDWGEVGNPDDDPVLDVDDVNGFGPENIFLEPGDAGEYTVIVHYFSDDGQGPSNSWVEVFIEGERVGSYGPERLLRSGNRWNVVSIDWPSGEVSSF